MSDIQILELSRYNQLPPQQKRALRLIKAEILQSGGVVRAYLLVQKRFSIIGAYSDLLPSIMYLLKSFTKRVIKAFKKLYNKR